MARVPEKALEWLLGASGHRTRPRTYSWPALAVCAEHIRGTNPHFPSAWGTPASAGSSFHAILAQPPKAAFVCLFSSSRFTNKETEASDSRFLTSVPVLSLRGKASSVQRRDFAR